MTIQSQHSSNYIAQNEINEILWKLAEDFKGSARLSDSCNYVLTLLFFRYLSALEKVPKKEEHFVIPQGCNFDSIYRDRHQWDLGDKINWALSEIERANEPELGGVLRDTDFSSRHARDDRDEREHRLHRLLNALAHPILGSLSNRQEIDRVYGNAFEFLLNRFAATAGRSAAYFYTPPEVSSLLAGLLAPKSGESICDPLCGTGSLLIKVAQRVTVSGNSTISDVSLFGQENSYSTWSLCRMNMFIHGIDNARIELGNTLTNPQLLQDNKLMKFDVVVTDPPFSLGEWGYERIYQAGDIFNRFRRGIPPRRNGDYAIILHLIETTTDVEGRVGVVVPNGVLFRGAAEGAIRQRLIEENLLDAVIGLPANLFFSTSIPTAILIFKRGRQREDVLFIDASKDFHNSRQQNKLREEDVERILTTYSSYEDIEAYAHRATMEEIQKNDFDLNVARYVNTSQDSIDIDLVALLHVIEDLETQLDENRLRMNRFLKDFGWE